MCATRLQSRKFPESTTVSDMDISESEVEIGKDERTTRQQLAELIAAWDSGWEPERSNSPLQYAHAKESRSGGSDTGTE